MYEDRLLILMSSEERALFRVFTHPNTIVLELENTGGYEALAKVELFPEDVRQLIMMLNHTLTRVDNQDE